MKRSVRKVSSILPFFSVAAMFKRWVTICVCLTTFLLIDSRGLLAQSIPSHQPIQGSATWQPPVRHELVSDPVSNGKDRNVEPSHRFETSADAEPRRPFLQVEYIEPLDAVTMFSAGYSHQIIRAPRITYSGGPGPHLHSGQAATTNPAPSSAVDPVPHLLNHHATQPPSAVIPDASQREVWKSPYSYGFFGASGSRKWTRHYDYRDRGKEWRLR